jgi:hypothetical protein
MSQDTCFHSDVQPHVQSIAKEEKLVKHFAWVGAIGGT